MNYFLVTITAFSRNTQYIIRAQNAADALLAMFELNPAADDATRFDFDCIHIINYDTDAPRACDHAAKLTSDIWLANA